MKQLKRTAGILWMISGIVAITLMIRTAAININSSKGDIGKPVPWVIIITIFTPICIGLMIFGWYAWKGEYDSE